jgi:CYTH domain-containing protein
MSAARQPGRGRYARSERERRWLVAAVPPGAGRPRRIADRYLIGTTLRLRRVEDAGATAYKLGQKVRAEAGPSLVWSTNLYLTAAEYDLLAVLPAAVLTKTRWLVPHGPATFAVDEFDGPLRGLLLAEIELPEDELSGTELPQTGQHAGLPPWLGREVTPEDRYSGGALAAAGRPPDPEQ